MFSYYGSKRAVIQKYPTPKFNKIIEPFAGAANYSLRYWEKDITIIDKYETIINIWKWLQKCEISDINKLPDNLTVNDNLNDFNFETTEAKNLMGFLIGCGLEKPRVKPTPFAINERPGRIKTRLKFIKDNLHKIKHWNIILGDYQEFENTTATWFIDPPYQFGGHAYIKSNKHIDFKKLAEWCKNRRGQTIVCENTKADWLPFVGMFKNYGIHSAKTEAIWSNYKTNYDYQQMKLF